MALINLFMRILKSEMTVYLLLKLVIKIIFWLNAKLYKLNKFYIDIVGNQIGLLSWKPNLLLMDQLKYLK